METPLNPNWVSHILPDSLNFRQYAFLQPLTLIKYWEGMTKFLEIPGAPLDNNAAERMIKRSIMHRKASLFFKTEDGAKVGDCLMSLIQTCMANNENPVEYLIAIQKNARHVAQNPHLWLPWNYRNILRSVGTPSTAETTAHNSAST